ESISLINAENDAFGVTHPEVGGILADRWSFPKSLADVIRHHHIPEKALDCPELTQIVYFADLLMSRFIVGQELERMGTAFLKTRLEKIGMTLDQFPTMVERVPRQLFEFV
ncbi:MAG: HDOD domain-containing protein, partial [bacterium]